MRRAGSDNDAVNAIFSDTGFNQALPLSAAEIFNRLYFLYSIKLRDSFLNFLNSHRITYVASAMADVNAYAYGILQTTSHPMSIGSRKVESRRFI